MNMEQNKILAAVLVAMIVAWIGVFTTKAIFHEEKTETQAYPIAAGEEVAVAATTAAAPAGPGDIKPLLASADIEKGKNISKACTSCHSFDKGGPNRVGPNLFGVFGGNKAAHEGFAYSDALKGKGGSWDVDALNHFLFKPKDFAPGTKMTFVGIKSDEDRAALVAWLKTLK